MKRHFLPAILFLISFSTVTAQKWDRQMQLTRCSIKVNADIFTATTFIEMEFYNDTKSELEGLYTFQLQPHQVITAFQLELNGKFRDGTIEEKWKATNAYNTIVGKRIDPALLTMEAIGQYNLRIYPVPAKGSRKITMTIQQPMQMKDGYAEYLLPLNVREIVPQFDLDINVSSTDRPLSRTGMIKGANFINHTNLYNLTFHSKNISLDKALEFAIPIQLQQPLVCTQAAGGNNYFAVRLLPGVSRSYQVSPKKLTIFWDISASHRNRDIPKELDFIEKYLETHDVKQLTIVTFNFRAKDTMIFRDVRRSSLWRQFLSQQDYDGATQLGSIDPRQLNTDVAFIFSDGWNTYGKNRPAPGNVLLYTISTGMSANKPLLSDIVKQTGGEYIDLAKTDIASAVGKTSSVHNLLLNIRSAKGTIILDEMPGQDTDKPILLTGTIGASDTLYIFYGNSTAVTHTQKIPVVSNISCKGMIDRMGMFVRFNKIHQSHDWNDIVDFGIEEKVVTLNTAYIVLERVEDYIRYNITPPKELEAACEQLNYVKKDTRQQRLSLKQQQGLNRFVNMVHSYNQRIRSWDSRAPLMEFSAVDYKAIGNTWYANNAVSADLFYDGSMTGFALPETSEGEVVTTGMAKASRSVSYSSSQIRNANAFGASHSFAESLAGKVPGLHVWGHGNEAQVMIRGYSSLPAQRQPLLVLDGIATDKPLNDINVNDIDHVTVLKDATATAIYGSRGINGVIVVTSKRGKKGGAAYDTWLRTVLKNQEDVDYLQEIKQVSKRNKYEKYLELKSSHQRKAGFYFDMAQHLYESGCTDEAMTILSNAAEFNQGIISTQKAMAFVLESWKHFDDAILLYKSLIEAEPMNYDHISDLSWAYYQQGNIQAAVEVLYQRIIMEDPGTYYYYYSDLNKASLLEQMNAMINAHRDELDISFIPATLIRPLPVDLKIIVQSNTPQMGYIEITEPGGEKTTSYHPPYMNHGRVYYHSYNSGIKEYTLKEAKQGTYSVATWHNDRSEGGKIPSYIRMIAIKNYGRKEQEITVQHFCMDNQEGWTSFGEVKFGK